MKQILIVTLSFLYITTGFKIKNKETSDPKPENIFSQSYRHQWKGLTGYWRWDNDILTGETTTDNPIKRSTFLIWDREVEDFILNISFRISLNGNSGIYYRCERGPAGYDDLLGYQADIDGKNTYAGVVYENFLKRNRKVLAGQGKMVRISETDSLQSFPIANPAELMKEYIKENDWNDYELIVIGSTIVQKLNGQIVSMVEDRYRNRIKKGLFGFQLHQGPPMKVEFKDALFRELKR